MKNPESFETRRLDEFDLHDLCYRFFYPSHDEIEDKVKELKAHGQTEPIVVHKDIVIHGHVLFLAAEKLRLEQVKVVYPEQWMDAGLLGLQLIARGVEGKNLDLFTLAEHYTAWIHWKKGIRRRRGARENRARLREVEEKIIHEMAGCDRRTLERHVKALKLPDPVLDAFRSKALPMRICTRLCQLPSTTRSEIGHLIRQGVRPPEAVGRFLTPEPARPEQTGPKHARTAAKLLIRTARRCLATLEVDANCIGGLDDEEINILTRLDVAIRAMVKKNEAVRKRSAKQAAALQKVVEKIAAKAT